MSIHFRIFDFNLAYLLYKFDNNLYKAYEQIYAAVLEHYDGKMPEPLIHVHDELHSKVHDN